jgi:hypothetical protein
MNGLLANPVISGLLGGGPNAIRAAAEQQRLALAPRGGGGMSGAPGAIVTQDRSGADLGAGLAGLGKGLSAIGKMRADAKRQEVEDQAIAQYLGQVNDPVQKERLTTLAGTPEGRQAIMAGVAKQAFPSAAGPLKAGDLVTVQTPNGPRFVQANDAIGQQPAPKEQAGDKIRLWYGDRSVDVTPGSDMEQRYRSVGYKDTPTAAQTDKGAFGDSGRGRALDIVSKISGIPEAQRTGEQQRQYLLATWELSQARVIPGADGRLDVVYPGPLPVGGGSGGAMPAGGGQPAPVGAAPQPAVPGDPAQPAPGVPGVVPTASATLSDGTRLETIREAEKRDPPKSSTETTKGLELRTQIQSGELGIKNLRRALELNDKAYAGPTANWIRSGARLTGLDPDGVSATTEFENIILNNVLSQLKATFGGNPTEGERQILGQVSGSITMARSERAAVLNNAIEILADKIAASSSNLEALGSDAVTSRPPAQRSSDFSTMSLEEIIDVDPRNLNEPQAKAYVDRLRALGVPVGN